MSGRGLLILLGAIAAGALTGRPAEAAGGPLRAAVVGVEVALDPASLGPYLEGELEARRPWTPYEAEVARRLRVGSMGTGFFVNSRGYLVTNAHVVLSGVRYRTLRFAQSEWDSMARLLMAIQVVWVTVGEGREARCYAAETIAVAEDLDLAVLRVRLPPGEEREFSHLAIGDSGGLRVGQRVVALGFPEKDFQASGGEILALIHGAQVHEEMRIVRHISPETGESGVTVSGTSAGPLVRLQHNAPTGHGGSGGPILDSRNRVVGVVYALLADRRQPPAQADEGELNLAIVSDVLTRFLRDHAIAYTEAGK